LTPSASAAIQTEIEKALSLRLDYAILRGAGANEEPLGIRGQPNVTIQSLGANGAAITSYDWLVDAMAAVRSNNLEPNAVIYSSRTQQELSKLKDAQSRYLAPPPDVASLTALVSNQIGNGYTIGTSSTTSEAYIAQWDQVLLGVRPTVGVRIRILNERFLGDALQVGIIAWLRGDVQMAHGQAACVVEGIL
jgi:HK97 family phage major capsid protein